MSLVSSVGLTLLLLASPGQTNTPGLAECESASPRVDLVPEMTGAPFKACIGADIVTVFSFNTEMNRDLVVIQGRERFESFIVVGRMIVVRPKSNLAPEERFLMTVPFLDSAAPESATFLLIAHPALATRQIDVFRHARPVEAYQQEIQEAWSENAQLRSRVKELESQVLTGRGLADLLANNFVDADGIKTAAMDRLHGRHGDALDVGACLGLYAIASGRVALRLAVSQPSSQEWGIKKVFLLDDHGDVFEPITWIGKGPVPPDNTPYEVVLEWHLNKDEVKRPFALVVIGSDGRTVRVSRVVFPQ